MIIFPHGMVHSITSHSNTPSNWSLQQIAMQSFKKDLKAAFRHIPTSPYDYWLFVFSWKEKHYVNMFLPS